MKVQFKAKPESIYNMDDTLAYRLVKVPAFKRSHVDMNAARRHHRYGGIANSELFLKRLELDVLEKLGIKNYYRYLRLDRLPEGVEVNETKGLLVVVSFHL